MDIRKTKTCDKCKANVPLEMVRLYPKPMGGNLVLCEACLEKTKRTKTHPDIPSRAPRLPSSDYFKYDCRRCKYEFKVDENKANITYNLVCPYCGKSDKIARI